MILIMIVAFAKYFETFLPQNTTAIYCTLSEAFTVLFSNRTGHHSYLTKDKMEMTLMIMQLAMKMMTTMPLSILMCPVLLSN